MPKPYDFGGVHLDVDAGKSAARARPDRETPFRILVLGDFSGRANRGIVETGRDLGNRRPVLIDRDNFDRVLAKLAPALELPVAGKSGVRLSMRFSELEDFHPDRLYQNLDAFRALERARAKLSEPATFKAAVAEMTGGGGPEPAPRGPVRADIPEMVSGSLLDEMVEATESRGEGQPARRHDPLASYVRSLVEPYIVPKPDPKQSELLAQVDAAAAGNMRAILHHPEFQALEAAWRGLFFLIRDLETDTKLKVYLLDVSRQELELDLTQTGNLRATGMYKILVEQTVGTPGADPWALITGIYAFGTEVAGIGLLARMAMLARAAGAPFVASAESAVVGCRSFGAEPDADDWRNTAEQDAAWDFLQKLPEAPWIGLAAPRFLLRLPYGSRTNAIETMEFEEMPGAPVHEEYLWGNPALACTLLIAQAFTQEGWSLRPGDRSEISGLPTHVYKQNGEAHMKPCAEAWLSEKGARRIEDKGLMPIISIKDTDRVRVLEFQSVADPPAPLEGRWE
jgi:type VI secretion system protein ImpC